MLSHVRGDKVIIFKKKRRKGYQKRSGHRQDFTHVEITAIGARGTEKKKAAPKSKAAVAAEPAKEEVVAEVKKAPAKKAAVKKAPAAEKAAVKKAPATKSPKKPAKE